MTDLSEPVEIDSDPEDDETSGDDFDEVDPKDYEESTLTEVVPSI